MKKGILPFIIAGMGIMAGLNADAKDVYVYSASGESLGQLAKVKRIEFNNDNLTLVPVKGDNVSVSMSKFGFLAFKPVSTGDVSSIETTETTVRVDGDILYVESASDISSVSIYNVAGELVSHISPSAPSASVSLGDCRLNIIVVDVAGTKSTFKIAR